MRRPAFLIVLFLASLQLALGAQSGAPLPDRDAFFGEVRKRLASNTLLQSRYTFRERVTELNLNPFGRMGTGPIEVYEVYPVDYELTYRRLVERNGVAVARTEVVEQDRRFLRRYREWQRQLATERKGEREARLKRQADDKAKDQARAREALDIFDFSMERRETLEGQPAVVVSFKPRPHASPRSREGKVAKSFEGLAWIQEHDYEVMKVEATAVEDASIGGGVIGRLHKGARAVFIRRAINGQWLPVQTQFDGSGRALLVRKVTFNFRREYFDYRPFDPSELPARLGASSTRNN